MLGFEPLTVGGCCYTYSMNNNKNLKATRTLVKGDVFTYRGRVGTYRSSRSYPFPRGGAMYVSAYIDTDNGIECWDLNQAGSVQVH